MKNRGLSGCTYTIMVVIIKGMNARLITHAFISFQHL